MSIPNLLGYFQFRYRAGSSSLALPPATFASSSADAAGVRVPSAQALRLRRAEEIQHVWRPIILPAYYHMSIKKKKKAPSKEQMRQHLSADYYSETQVASHFHPACPPPPRFLLVCLPVKCRRLKFTVISLAWLLNDCRWSQQLYTPVYCPASEKQMRRCPSARTQHLREIGWVLWAALGFLFSFHNFAAEVAQPTLDKPGQHWVAFKRASRAPLLYHTTAIPLK